MAIDDIKNYIEQNQDKHPVDVLLNQLRASGYPESEIQAYLSGKDGAPLPAQAQTQIQLQLSLLGKIGKWLLGFVLYLISQFMGFANINPLEDARMKSRDARRVADIKQIQLALELYYDANAEYPVNLLLLEPQYIYRAPQDPMSRSLYFYEKRADGSYWLKAYLEDTKNTALRYDQNPGDQYYDVSN